MSVKYAAPAAWVVACFFGAAPAAAQSTAGTPPGTDVLFRECRSLWEDGKYEESLAKCRAFDQLAPSVGARLLMGDDYVALGKVASGWAAYVLARDLAHAKGDPRELDAIKRIDRVKPRLPNLVVRVMPQKKATVTVTEDGLALPPGSFGSSLPVDPGVHTLVATAEGRHPFRTVVNLAEGQAREVVVPVLEADAPVLVEDGNETRRDIGTGFVIGGGVTTVAGLVLGGLALSAYAPVRDACPNQNCADAASRSAVEGDANRANGFAIASTVTVTVGLVALAAGLYLRFTKPGGSLP